MVERGWVTVVERGWVAVVDRGEEDVPVEVIELYVQ